MKDPGLVILGILVLMLFYMAAKGKLVKLWAAITAYPLEIGFTNSMNDGKQQGTPGSGSSGGTSGGGGGGW